MSDILESILVVFVVLLVFPIAVGVSALADWLWTRMKR